MVAVALRRLPRSRAAQTSRSEGEAASASEWRPFAILFAMFCLSSSIGTGLLVYLPVYLVQARHTSPAASSVMTSIVMGAGAVGMVLGGVRRRRFSRRLVLLAPEFVLLPAILLLPSLGYAAMIPVAVLAGLAVDANFSLVIVIGQEYLPGRMGLAAGMLNGCATAVAGLVLYGLGALGDATGPAWVLYGLGLLPLGVRCWHCCCRDRLRLPSGPGGDCGRRVEGRGLREFKGGTPV